jgi:hypothetical protein
LVQQVRQALQQGSVDSWLRDLLPCRIDGWYAFSNAVKRYFADQLVLTCTRGATHLRDALDADLNWVVPDDHKLFGVYAAGSTPQHDFHVRGQHAYCTVCGRPVQVTLFGNAILYVVLCPTLTQQYLAPPQKNTDPGDGTYRWVCEAVV